MLWHNVACKGWPPLGLNTLLTVSPPCMWCNIGVFSGSTGRGRLHGIVFFPSTLLLFLSGWVTRQKKSLCTLFSPAMVWPIWKQPRREEDKRTRMWHAKAFRDLGQDSELVLEAWVSLVNASDRLQPPAVSPYPLKLHTLASRWGRIRQHSFICGLPIKNVKLNVLNSGNNSSSLTHTHRCARACQEAAVFNRRGGSSVSELRSIRQHSYVDPPPFVEKIGEERAFLHTRTWLNNPSQGLHTFKVS